VAAEANRLGIRAQVMLAEADRTGMTAIADLVTQDQLRPVIAGTCPLTDAAKAHASDVVAVFKIIASTRAA
jgi:zinc-binding alcohol dehydrogenase family protein